jgi:hypothetical protein
VRERELRQALEAPDVATLFLGLRVNMKKVLRDQQVMSPDKSERRHMLVPVKGVAVRIKVCGWDTILHTQPGESISPRITSCRDTHRL